MSLSVQLLLLKLYNKLQLQLSPSVTGDARYVCITGNPSIRAALMPRLNVGTVPSDAADLDSIQARLHSYGSADRYLTSVQDYLPALQPQGTTANQQNIQQNEALIHQTHTAVLQQLQSHTPTPLSGLALLAAIDATRLLPFGLDSIDDLLSGGMREATITEVAGETCSGKTQLCHLAAVTTAQRSERVVYFDTTNSFSAARASQMCQATYESMSPVTALQHITVVCCHSIYALLTSLDELAQQAAISDPSCWPRMVIVDSISALLSPVVGATKHHQGHVLVAETGRLLRHIADTLRLPVLVTNHVVGASSYSRSGSRDDAPSSTAAGAGAAGRLGPGDMDYNYKPALGEQWRGLPHVRLQLSRAPAADLVCATLLTYSMREPGHQAWFHIGEIMQSVPRPA